MNEVPCIRTLHPDEVMDYVDPLADLSFAVT